MEEVYGYAEEDIVVMTDEEPVCDPSRVPTRVNLVSRLNFIVSFLIPFLRPFYSYETGFFL